MDSLDNQDWLLESARNQPHLRHFFAGTPVNRSSEVLAVDPKRATSISATAYGGPAGPQFCNPHALLWLGQGRQGASVDRRSLSLLMKAELDWLAEMSPNPQMTNCTPYSQASDNTESELPAYMTFKEIPSSPWPKELQDFSAGM